MAYMPPGWPGGVHPPGTERFEATAVAWLYDVIPPEYRQHDVLHRYPAALAYMTRHHSAASVEGARRAYRTVRTEHVPPHAADQALTVLRTEGRRLASIARSVDLVERALRGEQFRETG